MPIQALIIGNAIGIIVIILIKGIKLYVPYRFIREKDLHKPFSSKDPLMDRYPLNYYYSEHHRKNAATIVKVRDEDIVCVALIYTNYYPKNFPSSFVNRENSLYIDMISNNDSSKKINYFEGASMLSTIGKLALDLNKKYVFLEADGVNLDRLAGYYIGILGFKKFQNEYYSKEWGGYLLPLYILAQDLFEKFL